MAVNRPFPVDPVLTAVTISYKNPAYMLIADEVLPRIPVGASRFSWLYHPIQQGFSYPDTEVGRRGRVERVEFSGEHRSDEVRDFALEDAIPITDIDDAAAMRARGLGTFDPVATAAEMLTDLILLDREVRVAKLVQNPASYGAERRQVLSGGDQFSDYANSDPIGILKRGFNSTLVFRPNTMVINREVWSVLSSHPHIVNACKGNVSSKGIVSIEDFLKLFSGEGLNKILIGEGQVNFANKGQSPTLERVWGKSISLLHINPGSRPEVGASFGMTAQFGSRISGQWEDKNIGIEGGTVLRVGERVKEIITAPDSGFLIQNVIGTNPASVPLNASAPASAPASGEG